MDNLIRLKAIRNMFSLARGDITKVVLAAKCAIEAHKATGSTEVLYIALTVLAKLKVYDRNLVGKLLDVIFNVNGSFLTLFSNTIFNGVYMIYGLVDDTETSEYILTMAADKCYEVNCGIVRFVDVPVCGGLTLAAIAAFNESPSAVLLFLRHGASPKEVEKVINFPPLSERKDIARLIARATPYPSKFLRDLLELPNPPTLKHLSKFVIRYRLLINNYLPVGISALPIFDKMRKFVDFLED